MLTSVELPGSQKAWTPPETKPLDETVWQAWLAKGREQDRRNAALRIKALKWVSVAGLLVAAALCSYLTSYDILVGFILAAGAMIVMFQAIHARHYTVAAVFGALALLYNPLAPVFNSSGGWRRAVVVAGIVLFVAALAWRNKRNQRMEHND